MRQIRRNLVCFAYFHIRQTDICRANGLVATYAMVRLDFDGKCGSSLGNVQHELLVELVR